MAFLKVNKGHTEEINEIWINLNQIKYVQYVHNCDNISLSICIEIDELNEEETEEYDFTFYGVEADEIYHRFKQLQP